MSDLNNDLESMLGDMVVQQNEQTPEQKEINEPQPATESAQMQNVQTTEQTTEQTNVQTESEQQTQESSLQENNDDISEEEMESVMLSYLSERLGREVSGFDEFEENQNTSAQIDESLHSLNKFVQETGRSVEDWLSYQAMDTSEMDDLAAVKIQLKSQYGNDITNEDLEILIEDKYSLDEDLYDESEIRLSKLQLKTDADKARREIENLRTQYSTPVKKQTSVEEEFEGIVNDEWLGTMSAEVDALDGIEFQVSKDKSFTFGLEDSYKSQLKSKNEQIEDFFGSYVDNDGQWDFEKWNMHQTVLDNIETIVKTAYAQGLGEGQRGLVNKAANVQYSDPSQVGDIGGSNVPNVEEQVRQALGLNDNGLTFKI